MLRFFDRLMPRRQIIGNAISSVEATLSNAHATNVLVVIVDSTAVLPRHTHGKVDTEKVDLCPTLIDHFRILTAGLDLA